MTSPTFCAGKYERKTAVGVFTPADRRVQPRRLPPTLPLLDCSGDLGPVVGSDEDTLCPVFGQHEIPVAICCHHDARAIGLQSVSCVKGRPGDHTVLAL